MNSSRKTNPSDSADEEAVQETEETAVSDSTAVKEAEAKSSEPSIQGDQEQVHSSTTEPLVVETKDQSKQKGGDSEDSPVDEKKEDNSDAGTTVETVTPNKKKAAARKRSVGKVSSGKSPRSSKYVVQIRCNCSL